MRLRITSDGKHNHEVFDADTGVSLNDIILSVTFTLEAREMPIANLEVVPEEIDVIVEVGEVHRKLLDKADGNA